MVDELVVRPAGDADDDRHAEPSQVRHVMLDERLDAVVVQADRIEHAGGRFDRSPGRVAGPRLAGDRLWDDCAQTLEIDQAGHFPRIAKRAGGHHDRIGQAQTAQLDRKVDRGGSRAHESRSLGLRRNNEHRCQVRMRRERTRDQSGVRDDSVQMYLPRAPRGRAGTIAQAGYKTPPWVRYSVMCEG